MLAPEILSVKICCCPGFFEDLQEDWACRATVLGSRLENKTRKQAGCRRLGALGSRLDADCRTTVLGIRLDAEDVACRTTVLCSRLDAVVGWPV